MSLQAMGSYRTMRLIRETEEQICPYIEDGTIKTPCHLYIGQEAIATGVCGALEQGDLVWGNHRSHGHYLAKGGSLQGLMSEIFCRNDGCCGGRGGSMHLLAKAQGILGTVPIVAGTIPLGVGAALSFKTLRQSNISVAFFGDGATEEGHVSESMNFAALYDLPMLFILENNLYSSHMPMCERRKQEELLQIAKAHGLQCLQVDGNDINAVSRAATETVASIKAGSGPAVIEFMTFRWRGHVGHRWDEDVGVKRKGELKEWLLRDPIDALKQEMLNDGIAAAEFEAIDQETAQLVKQAIATALASPFPEPATLTDHVYANTANTASPAEVK